MVFGLASAGYLAGRTVVQVRRQNLSYAKLPFATGFALDDVPMDIDRARGALVGIALGDALGAPRESLPVALCNLRYGKDPGLSAGRLRFMRRKGTITDDTQQTWLVARSIRDGAFHEDTFRKLLVDWLDWRIGEGRGTLRAVRALRDGNHNANRGQGNGATMRVAPIAVAFRDDAEAMIDAVRRSAALTHPDAEAIAGAEIIARATREHLLGRPIDYRSIKELTPGLSEQPERWQELLDQASLHVADFPLGHWVEPRGWVFDTVISALFTWLRHGDDWQHGLRSIYRCGFDTDTVGAIYLSLVGALRGASFFEPTLVADLQGVALLVSETDRLCFVAAGKS